MAWLGTWANRRKITISDTHIDAVLSGFPILLQISFSSGTGSTDITDIFDELETDSNRKKIAVTTNDGTTQCYVEIERWDHSAEKAELWVRVPSVASGAVTELYIYYDSIEANNNSYVGDTTESAAQNVWDSDFKLVAHMAQDPNGDSVNSIKDSTSNANHLTPFGSMTTADLVDGKVAKAIDFDGTNDSLSNASFLNVAALTVSCIVNITADNAWFINKRDGSADEQWQIINYNGTLTTQVFAGSGGFIGSVADGTTVVNDGYREVGFTTTGVNGGDLILYRDGISNGTPDTLSDNMKLGSQQLCIGRRGWESDGYANGILDEIRISETVRSPSWMKATYYSNWDGLVSYGAAEPIGTSLYASLPAITAEIQGGGFFAATLPAITAEIQGNVGDSLLVATLPAITAEIQGGHGGFLEASLPAITAGIKGGAILEATLPAITASVEGDVQISGDLAVTLPAITAYIEGRVNVHGDLVCTLPAITAELTGIVEVGGSLICTLPMITAELTGFQDISGGLIATLPMITAFIEGTTGLADDDGDPIDADECGIILRYSKVGY